MENKFVLSSLDKDILVEINKEMLIKMKRKHHKRCRSIPDGVIPPNLYTPVPIYHSRFTIISDEDIKIYQVMKEVNDLVKEISDKGKSDSFMLSICDHKFSFPIFYDPVYTDSDGNRRCLLCGAKIKPLNESKLAELQDKLHQAKEKLLSLWKNRLANM